MKINSSCNLPPSPGRQYSLSVPEFEGAFPMPDLNLPNPLVLPLRAYYAPILARIVAAQGAWVLIDPADLGGVHNPAKQSGLLQAAKARGLRLNTSFRLSGWCCARLVVEDSAPVVVSSLTTSHQVVFAGPVSANGVVGAR
jgi:hypothetical protein